MSLDAGTVLIQWAAGGMFFCWITTKRQLLSEGYGWLLRGVFGGLAAISILVAGLYEFELSREITAIAVVVFALAGVISSAPNLPASLLLGGIHRWLKKQEIQTSWLDLAAAAAGLFGAVAGAIIADGTLWLAIIRFLTGALFMGALTDTMLLGHWYLVQPGLTRNPLKELIYWTGFLWLVELVVWLLPTGMISVLNGSVNDGQDGLLGWFWLASTATTVILVLAGAAAIRERGYQAVMAVTGLAYLALLTGFAQDIVARLALDTNLN